MITFDVISIMPQMFEVIKSDGVVSRALKDSKVNLNLWNPRDYVNDVHHTIDDRPYGGGPGMVMMIEPLVKTIRDIKKNHENKKVHNSKVIYLSPKGKRLDQKKLIELSKIDNMILISATILYNVHHFDFILIFSVKTNHFLYFSLHQKDHSI